MENSTIRLKIHSTLGLRSVGGEHHFILSNVSSPNVITVLVEFAPKDVSLIHCSQSLLRPFCQLLTWLKKWMRMVEKLSPRRNILSLQWFSKFHVFVFVFLCFKCSFIVNHSNSLVWSSWGPLMLYIYDLMAWDGSGWAAMMRTGPIDASCVVWTLGRLYFVFLYYYQPFFYISRLYLWNNGWWQHEMGLGGRWWRERAQMAHLASALVWALVGTFYFYFLYY